MNLLFRRKEQLGEDDPNLLLAKAQGGDDRAREVLIKRFTPFILSIASQKSGRYIKLGHDEEASISLIAFNEAIDTFDNSRGVSFLSFADTVIKRRMIDYYRKEARHAKVVPISLLDGEDEDSQEVTQYWAERQSIVAHQAKEEATDRKEEIIFYSRCLTEYGISFAELIEISPKHEDARRRAMEAARLMATDNELKDYFLRKKELPLKQLSEMVDVSRKTLERQRKYIIAIAIIFIKDFRYIREYVEKIL
ncbi:MAG: RNA polymerase sigma factor SigI [Clostridia bacterium]|nr:RNA polymerase sigma factor SigI [Clostridia bacterium]